MNKDSGQFEPKIVGFFCKWCTSSGADLAGTSRMKYPPNIIPIRVMCTGRVDPTFVMTAFSRGADGVLIGGCHPGDCHYLEGNYKARIDANYASGTEAVDTSREFLLDVSPPAVALEVAPDPFIAGEDKVQGEAFVTLTVRDASPIEDWALDVLNRRV